MKNVTQAFKDAIQEADGAADVDLIKEVSYKRRYWDQATRTYKWETNWTVLAQDQVAAVSAPTGKLDTERLNEFKVSNVTLTLKNDDNRWRADNPYGIFGPDSGSRLWPYHPFWTKFRIRASILLYDGTRELVSIFTGLAVDYVHASNDKVQITVQGLESLLMRTNAEDVSTRVVEETMTGTVNGINKDFTTSNSGVGIIEEVSISGIKSVPGTDYTTSQLNEPTLPAKVTFTVAPSSGTIRCTYRYWQQNQKVEDLVGDLLTAAGIASVDQLVDPVLFPNSINRTLTQDSQADWLAGTLTDVEASLYPGDVKMDFHSTAHKTLLDNFTDGDFTSNPAWAAVGSSGSSGLSVVSGELKCSTGSGLPMLETSCDATIGVWQFDVRFDSTNGALSIKFYFMAQSYTGTPSTGFPSSYCLNVKGDGNLFLNKTISTESIITSTTVSADTSTHTYRISRSASGKIKVYRDGSLVIEVTDTSFSSSQVIGLSIARTGFANTFMDNIYRPNTTLTGTHVSQVMDASAGVSSYGKLTPVVTTSGGSFTYDTATSDDGISFDSYVAVADNGQIGSTVRRYIKVRVNFSCPSSAMNDPTLKSYSLTYKTSSTTVTLANFTGKTVYQAIQDLGKFANYEWGFTADEDFFFRAKTVTKSENFSLKRGRDLQEITNLESGFSRIYSQVKVTYGNFEAVIKAPGDQPKDALATQGFSSFDLDGGDILIAADANIASGVAGIFAAEVFMPRRRFRAVCKLLPYVDLSDISLVEFDQNQPQRSWFLGDTTVYMGQQDIQLFGPKEQLVSGMFTKVIGYRHDLDAFKTELDLEEIP
jgi:hypothetical protein